MEYDQEDDISPESRVVPTESIDQAQMKISGERFPELALEVCDNCCWCLTCFNKRGIVQNCPLCGHAISLIPMSIEEISLIDYDKKKGLSIHFGRKRPLR